MPWEREEAQRSFWWWTLPPCLPVRAGREALWEDGSACQGMGHREQRARVPGKRSICCRCESGLFCVTEIPRSTALLVKFQQVLTPISPARYIPLLPLTEGRCLGASSRTSEREKDGTKLHMIVSLPLACVSFSPALRSAYIYIYLYRHMCIMQSGHIWKFPKQPTAIFRKTDKRSQ